uniref:Beta-arrestin-2 n=1 Tax=Suricata suricatta TaxID=37032 RepID=A0A673T6J3_SURSU
MRTGYNTPSLSCFVTLQPGPEDTEKACGIDFEVRTFCAKSLEKRKSHIRNSVCLVIRKVRFAPKKPGTQPSASLDEELYNQGEPHNVNVPVTDFIKTVKKTKVSVRQNANICLSALPSTSVLWLRQNKMTSLSPSTTFWRCTSPHCSATTGRSGLGLDGKLKHKDTNLASSTIMKEGTSKEVLGILGSYRIKMTLVMSGGGDVSVKLPFVLMHPKPHDYIPLPGNTLPDYLWIKDIILMESRKYLT